MVAGAASSMPWLMRVCVTGQGGVGLLEKRSYFCECTQEGQGYECGPEVWIRSHLLWPVQVHKKDKVVSVDVHPLDENLVLTAGEKCGRECVKEAEAEESWPEGGGGHGRMSRGPRGAWLRDGCPLESMQASHP